MGSLIFDILKKQKLESNGVASRQDFALGTGVPFNTENILEDDNITLYAFDFSKQEAIFVQTQNNIDIYEYPFLYQAQYQFAEKIIITPFESIAALKSLTTDNLSLIFLYSVGRCGSTLLCKLLQCSPNIISISEPDILAQLVTARSQDKQNDQEISKLLKIFLPLLFRKNIRNSTKTIVLIKTRSFSIEIADLLSKTFPSSKSFFLYRNAYDVVRSSVKAFGEALERKKGFILENIEIYKRVFHLLPQLNQHIVNSKNFTTTFFIMAWLSGLDLYLELSNSKIILFAVRYEDLLNDTKSMMGEMCHHLSINPISSEDISSVMQEDSQSNSNLSQSKLRNKVVPNITADDEIKKTIDDIIEAYDPDLTADPLLPRTLSTHA